MVQVGVKRTKKYNYGNKYQPKGSIRNTHRAMKGRCTNPNNKNYNLYKGKLCNEWYDYKTFETWALNNGWETGLTIDRVDSMKGYEPDNCHFITARENTIKGNKERKLTQVKYLDKLYTKTELSRHLGITLDKLNKIIKDL